MTNHLTKRGPVYYFRRKVPAELVESFGRAQIMFSLNTRDPAEARRLAAEHTVATDREFAATRAASSAAAKTVTKREPVLLREYVLDPDTKDSLPSGDTILLDPNNPGEHIEVTLAGEPVALVAELPAILDTGEPLSKSYKRQIKEARQFKTGLQVARATHTERAAPVAVRSAAGIAAAPSARVSGTAKTLRDVVPAWITRNAPKAASIGYTNKALDLFEESVGVIPLRDLKKAHGAAFVNFLLHADRPFERKTASNHAACVAQTSTNADHQVKEQTFYLVEFLREFQSFALQVPEAFCACVPPLIIV